MYGGDTCLITFVLRRGIERLRRKEVACHEEPSRGVATDELLPGRVGADSARIAYNDESALCSCEGDTRSSGVAEKADRLTCVGADQREDDEGALVPL